METPPSELLYAETLSALLNDSDDGGDTEYEDEDEIVPTHLVHNMVSSCEEKCSICLESISSHQAHTLDCGHQFHTRCAIDWFRLGNGSCPLCRCEDLHKKAQVIDFDDAVRILMRKAAAKKAPVALKKASESLKRRREELRNLRADLRDFEQKSRGILVEMRKKRRRVSRARVQMERAEYSLVMPQTPFEGVTMPLISYQPPPPELPPPEATP